jgi:hypothetical protein
MNNSTMTLAPGAMHFVLQRFQQAWRAATAKPEAAPSAAEEAASVRTLADSYRRSNPSFASDLYAAADRHERDAELALR